MNVNAVLGRFGLHWIGRAGRRATAPSQPAARGSVLRPAKWSPTHQHRKGGAYRVLANATLEADRSDAVIYDDEEGTIWVRPSSEFYDGRFIPLDGKKGNIL